MKEIFIKLKSVLNIIFYIILAIWVGIVIYFGFVNKSEVKEKVNVSVENTYEVINMNKPDNWYIIDDFSSLANLDNYEGTEKINEEMNDVKEVKNIITYTKYNKEYLGVNPTIQIKAMINPTTDIKVFKDMVISMSESMNELFENYSIIDNIQELKIAGTKSFYFSSTYDLQVIEGEKVKIKAYAYLIPKEDYFYIISFSNNNNEDYSNIYNKAIDTINFIKK